MISTALLLLPLMAQAPIDTISPNFDTLPIESSANVAVAMGRRLANCVAKAGAAPDDALDVAHDWQAVAKGADKALPQLCAGVAYATLHRWAESEMSFVAARDTADPGNHELRARLGMMAGDAALAGGSPVSALTEFDQAKRDAAALAQTSWMADIAMDRARALVLLQRPEDAALALTEARREAPDKAQAWLLSATLARRMKKLDLAQQEIEQAFRLAPSDPQIALEAGVIAELAGHQDAARKDWRSVLAIDPSGPFANDAQNYLREIGPEHEVGPARDLPPPASKPAMPSISVSPMFSTPSGR